MRLDSFYFENYKPFEERVTLKLAPLTIFLGRNGSGKSAAIRLVPLFLQALTEPGQSGISLEANALSYGHDFTDLVHGKSSHGSLLIGGTFSHEGQSWTVEVALQSVFDSDRNHSVQVISHFLSSATECPDIEFKWLPRESKKEGRSY